MPANFDLTAMAIKAVCPNNEILYDDKNMPSVMVKIPKMTYAQLGLGASTAVHPAFIVNGQEVDAIYISKYQNIVVDSRAYSLPGEDPKANINKDNALTACTAKGAGWHLMTRAEWALLALWCKNNGTQPKGNNNYGKDASESNYKAIPMTKDGANTAHVATGTGPLSWSHDGTPSGIWDLNGNVSEWVGGIRLVKGELQILANNNGADAENSQAASSAQWKAIKGSDGTLITPDGTGTTSGSVKLDYVSSAWKWIDGTISSQSDSSRNCSFESVSADAGLHADTVLLLQALGLLKYDNTAGAYNGDYFYANNGADERAFLCGGYWHSGADAGVFFCNGGDARSSAGAHVGFRSAYVELPSA
jgi:hypothetical protein